MSGDESDTQVKKVLNFVVKVKNAKGFEHINIHLFNDAPSPKFKDPFLKFYNSIFGYAWKRDRDKKTGHRTYLCMLCNVQFTRLSHLNVHYNRQCYECPACDKRFYSNIGRNHHTKTVHGINIHELNIQEEKLNESEEFQNRNC